MKTQQTPTALKTELNFNPDKYLTVYFFKTTTWFGYLIRFLQWLLGAPWQSPNHVAIGYQGKLIELTTEGLEITDDNGGAYRLSDNVFMIPINEAQAQDLQTLMFSFQDLGIYFSLKGTIAFVWRLLLHRNRVLVYNRECDYADLTEVVSGKTVFYCPPITCTTLVWQPLDDESEPLNWRIFAPAFLELHLDALNQE